MQTYTGWRQGYLTSRDLEQTEKILNLKKIQVRKWFQNRRYSSRCLPLQKKPARVSAKGSKDVVEDHISPSAQSPSDLRSPTPGYPMATILLAGLGSAAAVVSRHHSPSSPSTSLSQAPIYSLTGRHTEYWRYPTTIVMDIKHPTIPTSLQRGKKRCLKERFSKAQVYELERLFAIQRGYLTSRDLEQTAKILNLKKIQVRKWFQNRRYSSRCLPLQKKPARVSAKGSKDVVEVKVNGGSASKY